MYYDNRPRAVLDPPKLYQYSPLLSLSLSLSNFVLRSSSSVFDFLVLSAHSVWSSSRTGEDLNDW